MIEVLSPSDIVAEIHKKEKLCLENGAEEFWRGRRLSPPGEGCHSRGITTAYRVGQEIPLRVFCAGDLNGNEILA